MDEDIFVFDGTNNTTKIIGVMLVVLVIVAICLGLWWSMSNNTPSANTSSAPSTSSSSIPHNQSNASQFPQPPTVNWNTLTDTQKSEVASSLANQLIKIGAVSPPTQPQPTQPTVVVVNSQPQPQTVVAEVDVNTSHGNWCGRHACTFDRCGCHPRYRCPSQGINCRGCIPIPAGALKATNEDYWEAKYYATPGLGLPSFGGIASLGCNCGCNAPRPCRNYKRLPALKGPTSDNYFTPFGPNSNLSNVPFISSVNAYSPYPAVESCWEKIGILTSSLSSSDPNSERNILNLYRRPIAPVQNLWAYQVQDAAGFVIPLPDREIRNGDTVTVPGKQGVWTAKTFNKDKYIWQC